MGDEGLPFGLVLASDTKSNAESCGQAGVGVCRCYIRCDGDIVFRILVQTFSRLLADADIKHTVHHCATPFNPQSGIQHEL